MQYQIFPVIKLLDVNVPCHNIKLLTKILVCELSACKLLGKYHLFH